MNIPIKKKERNLRVLMIFCFKVNLFIDVSLCAFHTEFNLLLFRQSEVGLKSHFTLSCHSGKNTDLF
jgi:hypothetical protein